MRRTLDIGVGLAALYLAVLTATMALQGQPALPLYDGLTPPPPYQWVKPPPGYGFNTKPEPAEVTVALNDTGSAPDGSTGVNGQVVLNLPAGAVPPRSGDTAVKITIRPLDPARLDPLPPGLIPDGNAYEIRMRYQPSGQAINELAVPGNIILATPEPASALLVAAPGRPWETVETQRVGGPDSVGGPFVRSGHYVAAIPGAASPRDRRSWLGTVRRILIIVLSVALVVNLADRIRQRRTASADRTGEPS